MNDQNLTSLQMDDTVHYGPRCILVCGLDEHMADRLDSLLKAMDWTNVPILHAGQQDFPKKVLDVIQSNPQNKGEIGGRAVITSGLTGKEIHTIMAAWNIVSLPLSLWAILKEESADWKLGTLLDHMADEYRKAMTNQAGQKPN